MSELASSGPDRIDGYSYGLFSELTEEEKIEIAARLATEAPRDDAAIAALGYLDSDAARNALSALDLNPASRPAALLQYAEALMRQGLSDPDPLLILNFVARQFSVDERSAVGAARHLGREPLLERSKPMIGEMVSLAGLSDAPVVWRNIIALNYLAARGGIEDNRVINDHTLPIQQILQKGQVEAFLAAADRFLS